MISRAPPVPSWVAARNRVSSAGRPLRAFRLSARAESRTTMQPCVLSASEHVIKVCGVTSPEDAAMAASAGADLIGMILWPKAGRSVSLDTAKEIAIVSRRHGAEPVGVFVDETSDKITHICDAVGITYAQLHGDGARGSFDSLPEHLRVIYVVHADGSGTIQTPIPEGIEGIECDENNGKNSSNIDKQKRKPEWFLVDSMKGGSGEKFDWDALSPPAGAHRGWLLAGGLNHENVSCAILKTKCNGVDVSSGVCDESNLRKDPLKVEAYVAGAVTAFGSKNGEQGAHKR
jgi:phosphoribosylanthranilate isomerase